MNITAIIYDADARRTAYILGTVIGNCKLFPAERAPRDWSGYANVITVAAGEGGPVVTAGLQKRVTFRPKGEDETVAAAELIAKAFCPPEAPMPTDALKARIDAFLEAHNTLALATGCGKWVRCTPLEYLRVDGRLYILTEGGLKFKGIWWNGAISAAVFDSYAGMASLAGLQMTGTAVYIDPLSDEYRSVIEARACSCSSCSRCPRCCTRCGWTSRAMSCSTARCAPMATPRGRCSIWADVFYFSICAILWLGSTRSETGHRGR